MPAGSLEVQMDPERFVSADQWLIAPVLCATCTFKKDLFDYQLIIFKKFEFWVTRAIFGHVYTQKEK